MDMKMLLPLWLTLAFIKAKSVNHSPKPDLTSNIQDKKFWQDVAESELKNTLKTKLNENVAKNVIFFLGDGMGISTITAARIYVGQNEGKSGEEEYLSFEHFPHSGLIKVYAVNYQVPDSASTGTAYLSGVKTNKGMIGVDAVVKRGKCSTFTNESIVHSIAKLFQDQGRKSGLVTSTRITHATPANIYAHTPDRDWECDEQIPDDCPNVKDIARQLIEDETGRKLNVIMGGGLQEFDGSVIDTPDDPIDKSDCIRSDGRVLWKEWLSNKEKEGKSAVFVRNKTMLNEIDYDDTDEILGVFANNHIPYEYEKRTKNLNIPTLAEMTEAAIKILKKEDKGFFLLVEGGRIDMAHHSNKAKIALDETAAFHEAIKKAVELTDEKETLIITTADHSHTLTLNGYPKRGNPITGIAEEDEDDLPYTTLMYTNGPGYNFEVKNNKAVRQDITNVDTDAWDYRQNSAVPRSRSAHGGEDVSIYARGPMSHLFTSVHEQNYIPHAIAYAACVGKYAEDCRD